ncbi:MAG: hypothetical protein IPI77_17860 [Saprospiraceae bacterium]|nr:hypothetical protein [Saprospiraceae bacterium]
MENRTYVPGVIQSEQMYKSLKVMGKTVEYVRHPGASHEITEVAIIGNGSIKCSVPGSF